MGLWDHFLVARSHAYVSAELPGAERLGLQDGWQYLRLPMDGSVETNAAVSTAARALCAPAIGAFVADSDAAAIFFGDPSGASGSLAINRSYDDSDEDHTQQWLDAAAHRQAADSLARWAAEYAPRRPSGAEIVAALAELGDDELGAALGERHILMAEDGLRVVFEDLLGLAPLDEAVFMAGDL